MNERDKFYSKDKKSIIRDESEERIIDQQESKNYEDDQTDEESKN